MRTKKTLFAVMLIACGLLTAVPSIAQEQVWWGPTGVPDYTSTIYRYGWLATGNYLYSGYSGTGTANFEVNQHSDTYWSGLFYNDAGGGQGLRIKGGWPSSNSTALFQIEANSVNSSAPGYPYDVENVRMIVLANGNVGIGITNPSEPLVVNGMICAQEIHISLNSDPCSFPDYVFAKDYRLMPLPDLKNYLLVNKHLPELPTAAQAADHGIEVGAMQVEVLKKVEELTLYVIQLKEENEALKKRLEALEAKKQ